MTATSDKIQAGLYEASELIEQAKTLDGGAWYGDDAESMQRRQQAIVLAQNINAMKKILAASNMKISIGGCGCCGSPWVKFEYNGEVFLDGEKIKINMFE